MMEKSRTRTSGCWCVDGIDRRYECDDLCERHDECVIEIVVRNKKTVVG